MFLRIPVIAPCPLCVCVYILGLAHCSVRMAERVGRVIQARSELCTTRTLKYRSAVDPSSIIRRAFKCFSGSTTERFHTQWEASIVSTANEEGRNRSKNAIIARPKIFILQFRAIKKKKKKTPIIFFIPYLSFAFDENFPTHLPDVGEHNEPRRGLPGQTMEIAIKSLKRGPGRAPLFTENISTRGRGRLPS